jgi:hypothetical protein
MSKYSLRLTKTVWIDFICHKAAYTTALQRQACAIVTQPHCFTPPAVPEPLNSRDTGAKECRIGLIG